jgi:hypothetical protein
MIVVSTWPVMLAVQGGSGTSAARATVITRAAARLRRAVHGGDRHDREAPTNSRAGPEPGLKVPARTGWRTPVVGEQAAAVWNEYAKGVEDLDG